MENDQEIADLKALYTELANNGKRLAKDIKKTVDFYLLLGAISLLLSFFSLAIVGGFAYYIWQGMLVAGGWGVVGLFVIISAAFLGFGVWLVWLYFGWRGRYKGLLEMEKKWSKADG
jgi:hypothetical protein